MELGPEKKIAKDSEQGVLKRENEEVVSFNECKIHLSRYELSDQSISRIKDNLVGIVDSIFNSYLEEFK